MTLSVFSGVDDPRWMVEPTQEILVNYKKAADASALHKVAAIPSRLGYRGFIIQDDKGEVLVVGTETKELQLQLLGTVPQGLIPNKVLDRVKGAINSGKVVAADSRRKRYAPAYNAAPWGGNSLKTNNCYNYATLKRTGTFAQPGRGSGNKYSAITKERIQAAAVRDGLTAVANGNTPAGNQLHVVALVVNDCKYQSNSPIDGILQIFTI